VSEDRGSVGGFGVLVSSHSAAHSSEGFSVRISEEVKRKVLEDRNSMPMNRAASYDGFLGIGQLAIC